MKKPTEAERLWALKKLQDLMQRVALHIAMSGDDLRRQGDNHHRVARQLREGKRGG